MQTQPRFPAACGESPDARQHFARRSGARPGRRHRPGGAPVPVRLAAVALAALATRACARAGAADALWETTVMVGNVMHQPDATPGEEWERGFRRQ